MALRALEVDLALRAQARLLSTTGNERLGVLAAGIIGDPRLVSWLLDRMASQSLARFAGAAFCHVTGCDLRRHDFDAVAPRIEEALQAAAVDSGASDERVPPSSVLSDSPLANEDDDELPWPDRARLNDWWLKNRTRFNPDARYLMGRPIRASELGHVLRVGNQQQRAAAALELALLDPNVPVFDVLAPAHVQAETQNWPSTIG
jgi:uncharacterized protein (TIGR02270 family)